MMKITQAKILNLLFGPFCVEFLDRKNPLEESERDVSLLIAPTSRLSAAGWYNPAWR